MIRIVFWTDENSSIEAQWPLVPMPGDRVTVGSKDYIVERREFVYIDVFIVHVILIEIK